MNVSVAVEPGGSVLTVNGVVPIPGTKHRRYLDENIGALDVKLTAEDLQRLDQILPPGAAAGERYHAQGMATVNR